MQKAIGYVRVSTEEQAAEGVSLEAQEAKIAQWCEFKGVDLVTICSDCGISGHRMRNRPGLQDAVDLACKEGATLVVYSLSRLARNAKETMEIAERIQKAGANLASLTEAIDTTTAMGKFFFQICSCLSELERNQTAERTRLAMQFKKRQGKRVGTIPYGYDLSEDAETLVENPGEQRVIELIRKLRRQGLSLRAIAKGLESRGIETKGGKQVWHPQVIKQILSEAA